MATYEARVVVDNNIVDEREHCAADREQLATVGRDIRQQVRIIRPVRDSNMPEYALYTVTEEVPSGDPRNTVRMGGEGRARLGENGDFTGTLDSQVTRSELADEQASKESEFVERLKDNGRNRGFIVMAPHGGKIEEGTDLQAKLVHFLLTCELKIPSLWVCKGFDGPTGAFDRWHITATDIHEASFPLLRKVIFRDFRHAVAFHGYRPGPSQPDILVGGTSFLKEEIVRAINDVIADPRITVCLSTAADKSNGDSRQNIVNRLTADRAGGVQIEQSLRVRTQPSVRDAIAQAVARVYATKLRRFEGCRIRRFPGIVDPFCVMRSLPFDPRFVQCAIAAARGRSPRL